MNTKNLHISVIAIFLWIGFIGAISFMEAWIKFQASGVTLSIGVGIGKLVFSALNKVEWVLAFVVLMNHVVWKRPILRRFNLYYLIALFLLLTQTVYLLPELDVRADMIIRGETLVSSYNHVYYVVIEVLKVVSLFAYGISILKTITK